MDLAAGLNSARTIFDLAKGYMALKTQAEKDAAIFSIQREALDTQEAYSAALKRVGELEQEVVRLKDWEAEKQRYELKAIGGRAFAYAQKNGVENPAEPHWLCQPCFDGKHKSALQFQGVEQVAGGMGMKAAWGCGICRAKILVPRNAAPQGDNEE